MSDFLNPHIQRSAIRWTPGDVLPEVEQTGPAAPLLIDKDTGRLLVDLPAYSDPYTTNGLLHSIEADIVAVKDDTAKIPALISGRVPVDGSGVTQPVSGPLTDTQLRASAVPISSTALTNIDTDLGALADAAATSDTGSFSLIALVKRLLVRIADGSASTKVVNGANTLAIDASGRQTVNVNGTVPVSLATAPTTPVTGTFWQATQPVSGPLTDTQLRATAVPISGTVTANTGLSQPLTDTQLRASAVPVSGTVTANTGLTQPLTDTQLRASAVGVTLPNASTSALTTFTSTTSAQILASSSSRRGVVLSSPSTNTGICYIVLGTSTASSTACSFLVNPGDVINLTGITTALTGIWSTGSQTLFVTDLT